MDALVDAVLKFVTILWEVILSCDACWVIFMLLLSSADVFQNCIFFFSKKIFQKHYQSLQSTPWHYGQM